MFIYFCDYIKQYIGTSWGKAQLKLHPDWYFLGVHLKFSDQLPPFLYVGGGGDLKCLKLEKERIDTAFFSNIHEKSFKKTNQSEYRVY